MDDRGDGYRGLAPADAMAKPLNIAASALLVVLVIHALTVLFLGLSQPLQDLHYFRQTQTALTAYWLWRGGPWLAYETPVVGYPWSIPFEFPLYQGMVALLRVIGIPIDIGGRLVSFGFYLATLWPLWMLFRTLRLGRLAFLAVAILFLSSPLYLYWSRTVMIESCALFFGLLWLALLADFLANPRIAILLLAIAAGTAGALTKLTTFPAFAVLGGFLMLHQLLRDGLSVANLRILALAILAGAAPVALCSVWVSYADAIKSQSAFGVFLTSKNSSQWNFGTWHQRVSAKFWRDVMLLRVLPDTFGYAFPFAMVIAGTALASRRLAAPMVAAVAAFVVPLAIFTNLHLIHSYYQYANAIFALAAVGIGITSILEAGYRRTAALCLTIIVAMQIQFFWQTYASYLTVDYSKRPLLQIALIAKDKTPADSSLIVLGDEWASAVPYYSERKAFALSWWLSAPF